MQRRNLALLLSSLCLVSACSQGGTEQRPGSDVKLDTEHHLVGIRGVPNFGGFPVAPDTVLPFRGTIRMTEDSRYELRSGGQAAGGGDYALETSGVLSILVPTSQQTQLFRGGYGLEGETDHQFFTDRVGGQVGIFLGVPLVAGDADIAALAGDWNLLSMHVMFAAPGSLPAIHDIGRAFGGTLTVEEDGSVAGSGHESTNIAALLPLSGEAGAFKAFADGVFELDLDYGNDTRGFTGGGTTDLLFAVDEDETDGAAGLIAMLRARAAEVDPDELAGSYIAGLWTIFLKPSASGFDSAIGTLEFTADGNFRLDAVNNIGQDFAYSGTFEADDTNLGAIGLAVDDTNETWFGAVGPGDDTIVIVDNFIEARASNQVELNLIVAVRKVTPIE